MTEILVWEGIPIKRGWKWLLSRKCEIINHEIVFRWCVRHLYKPLLHSGCSKEKQYLIKQERVCFGLCLHLGSFWKFFVLKILVLNQFSDLHLEWQIRLMKKFAKSLIKVQMRKYICLIFFWFIVSLSLLGFSLNKKIVSLTWIILEIFYL